VAASETIFVLRAAPQIPVAGTSQKQKETKIHAEVAKISEEGAER
jgi:hypothetical protein